MSLNRIAALVLSIATLGAASAARAEDAFRLHLLDATIRDKAVPGAEIILQRTGEASVKGASGADGRATLPRPFGGKDDDSVTLIVKKGGYSPLVVKCPCNGLTYALSPVIRSLDGLRVVLNWGAAPADLDSHLVYEDQHVFFDGKKGKDASLDVDQTNGYGPETITLARKHAGTRYLYAVHNYTDGERIGTASLSTGSQAKVFVYVGSSLVRTFRPPSGVKGNVWVVFGVGENGEFHDVNRFYDVQARGDVGRPLAEIIKGGPLVSAPVLAGDARSRADATNLEGEKAYHAKRLEEAVQLYLEAIDLDPEHSQAYSNLGLAYQKLGSRAEALWANRKAISLASGANAANVRASSWYNVARVYEEQGEWQQALDAFQAALAQKPGEPYSKGIERMKLKLGR